MKGNVFSLIAGEVRVVVFSEAGLQEVLYVVRLLGLIECRAEMSGEFTLDFVS